MDAVVNNEIAQISMINSLMDMLFMSRMLDMISYDNDPRTDTIEEWANEEVDVYLSEVCV